MIMRLGPFTNRFSHSLNIIVCRKPLWAAWLGLQAAIKQYLADHNAEPKPFVWTTSAASILAKLDRLPARSV